ncbi:unnamed protein product [Amoebophrya sp. A25]|nr:unnamed protein product [Amoebophrya sp. A25]|eukprot:GSA25T00012832001.1
MVDPDATDFAAALEADRGGRTYGCMSAVPEYFDIPIDFNKSASVEEILYKNQNIGNMLVRIHSSLRRQETEFHKALLPHIAFVYKNKSILFFEAILERAASAHKSLWARKSEIMSIIDKMTHGIRQDNDIRPSGFWGPVCAEEVAKRRKRAEEATTKIQSASKLPERDHWADESLVEEMWQQMSDLVDSGRWTKAPLNSSLPLGGSKAFPVVQGGKARVCVDFRFQNTFMVALERMRLLGARATTQISSRLMSSKSRPLGFWQFKQDIAADISQEKLLRASMEVHTATSREVDPDSVPDGSNDGIHADSYAFRPLSAKKDLRQFYYQLATAEPNKNAVFFPIPWAVEDSEKEDKSSSRGKPKSPDAPQSLKRPKRDRKWVVILSWVQLFGSLASVHDCVHVSECIMCILNLVLLLVSTVYVDDVHSQSRAAALRSDSALVDLFLALAGWEQADAKQEHHDEALKRSLTVLGIAYQLVNELHLACGVDISKLTQLADMGVAAAANLEAHCLTIKELESFRGLYRHCVQLDRGSMFLAKGVDPWCSEAFFHTNTRKKKERRALLGLIRIMIFVARSTKPLLLSTKASSAPLVHLYTDAALVNQSALRDAIAAGQRSDLDQFSLNIGGFLFLSDATQIAFSGVVRSIPCWVAKLDIGVLETFAARVARDFFRDHLRGKSVVLHCDNVGAVYALGRCSSRCATTQRIAAAFAKFSVQHGLSFYVAWVSTMRNIADVMTRLERLRLLREHFPRARYIVLGSDALSAGELWGDTGDMEKLLMEGPSRVFSFR